MELRIAIVEDQKFEAQRLERQLRQAWGDPVVCDLYESGDAFLHRTAAGPYAVVFLDICMEGTNGIGTARQLREKDPHLLIVFVTSSPEYVWEAFPVHPFDYLLKPYKEEKIRQLSAFVNNFGYHIHTRNEVRPKEIQKLLDKAEGTPEEGLISRLALRSMKRARYTTENTGHFGLAAKYYTHFTSPIRRYPDLQIHRIIKETLRGRIGRITMERYCQR